MTLANFIIHLQGLVNSGANPDAIVKAWDPEDDTMLPVTGTYNEHDQIEIDTDPEH